MENKLLIIIFICFFIIIIVSCTSKFDKEQRIVQEQYTEKTADLIKKQIDTLSQNLSNRLKNKEDINDSNFSIIKSEFNEVSAIASLNLNKEIIKILPVDFNKNYIESYFINNKIISNLLKRKGMQIYPSTSREESKYLIFLKPLFDEKQNLENIVIILLDRVVLFEKVEYKSFSPLPYSLCILNRNGIILYHANHKMIGLDFTVRDKPYSDKPLENLEKMMMQNDISYSTYKYDYKTSTIRKLYTWNAITLLNTKWWIILTRDLEKKSKHKNSDIFILSTLRSYTTKDTLIDAVIDNNTEIIEGILTEIYQLNPQIYVIQLADVNGKIISGWPSGNRTLGYSYTMRKNKNFDNALKTILNDKKEKIIHSSLIEGGEGTFSLIPITIDEKIIGVLFSIEIEKE